MGHRKEINLIRKNNYEGKITDDGNDSSINKTDFGTGSKKYTVANTYKKTGGFSHFFASNLSVVEAYELYNSIVVDDLYDGDLLSIALEIMFYNENYQTGKP